MSKQTRSWFFVVTATLRKRGLRFKSGDRPTEATYQNLTDSVLFKTEAGDRAKEDSTSAILQDTVGHVVAASDAQAKAFQDKKTDRTIAVQPNQLPQVESASDTITSTEGDFTGIAVEAVVETGEDRSNKRNVYITSLSDGFIAWLQTIANKITTNFNSLTASIAAVAADLVATDVIVSTHTTEIAALTTALSTVTGGAVDVAEISPVGVLMPYTGSSDPNANWMLADGRTLDRTAYAALFAIIGTTYGAPSGTEFSLPDTSGKNIKNAGGSYTLGASGGSDTKTLLDTDLPYHKHPIGAGVNGATAASTQVPHAHTVVRTTEDGAAGGTDKVFDTIDKNGATGGLTITTPAQPLITLTGETGDQGTYSQTSVSVVEAHIVFNHIIKVL
jgi:microcystin-dependent protein